MNLLAAKQNKPILIFALAVAILGGVFYGGYRCWQGRQVVSKSQESEEVSDENIVDQHFNPQGEETYRIVENEDGTKTFYNYHHKYKIVAPVGWEALATRKTKDPDEVSASLRKADTAVEDIDYGSVEVTGYYDSEKFLQQKKMSFDDHINREVARKPDTVFRGFLAQVYTSSLPFYGGASCMFFGNGELLFTICATPSDFVEKAEYQQVLDTFDFLD